MKRNDKVKYIKSLELADKNHPQELVSFFAQEQKKSIELALNFKSDKKVNTFTELASLFNTKIDESIKRVKENRKNLLDKSRNKIFNSVSDILNEIKDELHQLIPIDKASIKLQKCRPSDERYYYHTHQIAEYANKHSYFFNRNLPRGWVGIYFSLPDKRNFNLIISVHHYGYDDDVVAIGTFLENIEFIKTNDVQKTSTSINVEPFTISLESINSKTSLNLKDYIQDIVKIGLAGIIDEIN